jgi:hypothetical protein
LVLLAAEPAAPPPRSLGILVATPAGASVRAPELYRLARQAIEAETALEVGPSDLFAESEGRLLACGRDARCFGANLKSAGIDIDILLALEVVQLDEGPRLELRLFDVRRPADLGATAVDIRASLAPIIQDTLPKVFPSSVWGQVGRVAVEVEPSGAEVQIGSKTCIAPCEIGRLRPGAHTILVRRDGYLSSSAKVELTSRSLGHAKVVLEPADGWYEHPLVWAGVGVAVVAGTVAAILLLGQKASGQDHVCITGDLSRCP